MTHRITCSVLLALTIAPPVAFGAPCVRACRDEVAACVEADCQGLSRRPLRSCKRHCTKSLVHDCYRDLAVCGATTARPQQPPAGGGGPPTGGW